ncbi:MAG: hypothetical protein ACFCVE_08245, partial [Phycisphaerae bacterium]
MPRLSHAVPKLSRHKATGQARVRLNGHSHYLGRYSSPDARQAYDRLIAEWLANGRRTAAKEAAGGTVAELLAGFLQHCELYYRHLDGRPTTEVDNFFQAMRPINRLYGLTPVAEFSPRSVRAIQHDQIRQGLCRTTINDRVSRIKAVFAWGLGSTDIHPLQVTPAASQTKETKFTAFFSYRIATRRHWRMRRKNRSITLRCL